MVFHAINLLLSTLREIDRLLKHPTDEQLLQYYLVLDASFVPDYRNIENRIAETHKQDKPNRKKENDLRALRDELFESLIKSGVLNDKLGHCNQYEVNDFMKEHEGEFSDDYARIIVSIEDFGNISDDISKVKFARYLFERRKSFSVEQIGTLFVYLHEVNNISKNIGFVSTTNDNMQAQISSSQTIIVQGDYIAGDKHVGAHIDNVSPGAIGAQTTKD
jgi:hypothetical protein